MEIPSRPQIPLHLARPTPDGLHTGTDLSYGVRTGDMLRLRRGVYVPAQEWLDAAPWERPVLMIAATALADPETVFCRTSALLLHGIPLLHPPQRIHVRTMRRSSVRITRQTPMTGRLSADAVLAKHRRPPARAAILQGMPTQRHEPMIPPDQHRSAMRSQAQQDRRSAEELLLPQQMLPPTALRICQGPAVGYRAEPLELAAVDTATRLPAADAVVILDAVLARLMAQGTEEDEARRLLLAWKDHVSSRRRRALLQRRLAFADPRAESPGESWSRVRIHELGFVTPELQTRVALETGHARLDFEWRDAGVVGEFDGRIKYLSQQDQTGRSAALAVHEEKIREDGIRRTGRTVVRWGWEDLRRPTTLGTRLCAAGVPRLPSSQIVSL
ncbi:hypothetical protein Q7C18_14695 [Nesterenkonia sp. CL21]|uniref:hypothetical protein n=1 Tax=Nesterenkonia sp. CL21 TaxID=3064894 RepID=UPI0028787DD0|nr:hypothetical protein [Nesterenkonia sp. CL21]MDS2173953.1 hypothetical protein [Nesterenkonia sp. CL21]